MDLSPPRSRNGLVAVSVLAAALALGACGSSSPSPSATTSSSSSKSKTTPTSSASMSTSSRLSALSSSLQGAESATFKATYSATDNGQSETVTFEQDPPKSYFGADGGEVIDTGTATYFCSTSGTPSCLSATTEDPLASLLEVLSPKTTIDSLQAAQAALVAKTAGYSVSFSSQDFAGLATTCVTVSASSGAGKYCVTGTGQLAYVSTSPSQVFELTSYSTSVDASDFSLPPGATVVTLPAGG